MAREAGLSSLAAAPRLVSDVGVGEGSGVDLAGREFVLMFAVRELVGEGVVGAGEFGSTTRALAGGVAGELEGGGVEEDFDVGLAASSGVAASLVGGFVEAMTCLTTGTLFLAVSGDGVAAGGGLAVPSVVAADSGFLGSSTRARLPLSRRVRLVATDESFLDGVSSDPTALEEVVILPGCRARRGWLVWKRSGTDSLSC